MATKNPTGKAILQASLQLFRQDPQMIWLPVMATVTALLAFAIVTGPLVLLMGYKGFALALAVACGSVVATAATVIFNVALAFAANDRIEGRTPTISSSMGQAWGRRGVIFEWALLSAVRQSGCSSSDSGSWGAFSALPADWRGSLPPTW